MVPLDLRSRPVHSGVEVSTVRGGQELDPEGRLGAFFGQVQLIDVKASAFILHDHPVKGYFTASETFLGKTTTSPPGSTR